VTDVPDRLRLPISADADALRAEVFALPDDAWVPHFNTQYYEGDWSGVALRSIGGSLALYPDPTRTDYADTPWLDVCPAARALLERFRAPLLSARYLRVGPGSRIREHSDLDLGFADGEVRIHCPVTTSPQVQFLLAGETIVMQPGELWYLDLNQKHAVTNDGTEARVHLVIDCVVNEWLEAQFANALASN